MINYKLLKNIDQQFTVLYAEDDKDVRDGTVVFLENFFKHVKIAEDGQEAIGLYDEYFQSNGKYFDIVITDIQMPHMNGIDFSKEVLSKNKEQKILVTSAFDDKDYLIELINTGVSRFVQKPLVLEQITSILHELCSELAEERELFRFLDLGNEFVWDSKDKTLVFANFKITLTHDETELLSAFIDEVNDKSITLKIFEHIYQDNEITVSDEIKSIIENLQKKYKKSYTNILE